MRLLFLGLSFPLPANNGHKLRTWALLRALAAEGHKITLLAFARQDEALPAEASLPSVCQDVEIVPLAARTVLHRRDIAGRLARVLSPRPYSVTRFDSAAMRAKILSRLHSEPFDAIVCDVFTIVNVPSMSAPVILNNENVEHVLLRRYLPHEPNLAKRGYARLEARKMERWERAAWRLSTVALACSDADRRMIATLCPGVQAVVAPNVVDSDTYTPNGDGEPGRVLFQGAMDWFPNQDAVAYFISEILPTLRSLAPHVTFVAAGRSPSPALLRRFAGTPDVEFTGTIPDMREELVRASVCAVPLRIGSGTRLKILEAAAMAKPIVTTRVGTEGLDFVNRQEILLADEPRAFAQAVASLLGDLSLRRTLGQAARRRLERHYTLDALRTSLADTLRKLDTAPRAR